MGSSTEQIKNKLTSDLIVDGVINFLRNFFKDFPMYTWDEDDTKTAIQITDFDSFNLEGVDMKPRIAVELMEGHWENTAVDNMLARSFANKTKTISDLIKASVTVHCVSSVSVEAKRIADIVFEAVRIFREEIRKEAGFFNVDSLHRGREQRVVTSSVPVTRVVPVEINVQIQRTGTKNMVND